MRRSGPYPELVVALASAAWGLFWIPLRALERGGLDPAWATLAQFVTPLIVLIPFALYRRSRRLDTGVTQVRTGLLVGAAVALYLQSLLLTEVSRALILFYAMPAWGTLLEIGVLGRRLTPARAASLLLSGAGMFLILGGAGPGARPVNLGDGMALLSGILFSIGALRLRRETGPSVPEQLVSFFLYGSVAALALALLPLAELGRPPSPTQLMALAPWLFLLAAGFLIPVMWGIYWGSRRVDPGRLGLLLQIEAVVGIGSAALFAGEPFGLRQAIGAALVIGAGVTEVAGSRSGQHVESSAG